MIPTAHQARKLTLQGNDVILAKLGELIKQAMNAGHFSICTYIVVPGECISELAKLGYDIGSSKDEMTGITLTYISWKE